MTSQVLVISLVVCILIFAGFCGIVRHIKTYNKLKKENRELKLKLKVIDKKYNDLLGYYH